MRPIGGPRESANAAPVSRNETESETARKAADKDFATGVSVSALLHPLRRS